MRKRKVSSEDVAKLAGVSRTTVSFVLNNTPGKNISEETRQRVLKAAAELSYTPNENARRLAMTRHMSIGLFICHSKSIFSDAFIIRLMEGMAQVLNRNRFQLVIQPVRLDNADYLALAQQDSVSGIILLNTHEQDQALMRLIEADFPLVVIGSLAQRDVYRVDIDNCAAAREAVEYLISLGHRKIAMITHASPVFYAVRERLAGYRQALRNADIHVPEDWVRIGDFTEQSGYDAMKELLSMGERPTAVYAGKDSIAYGAIKAAKDAGLAIPGDISVVGFDDDYLSRYINPPLTTMSLPAAGLGAAAADLLIKKLTGKELPETKKLILPTHLARRNTCSRLETLE